MSNRSKSSARFRTIPFDQPQLILFSLAGQAALRAMCVSLNKKISDFVREAVDEKIVRAKRDAARALMAQVA